MPAPVSSLKNLGPATDASFARAGINSAEELREMGLDEAYRRLIAAGTRPHFIGYYAIAMGLQERHWNDITQEEKDHYRARFDALKAGTTQKAPSELDEALDLLGVKPKA